MAKMKDADLRDLVAKRRDASFKHVSGRLARDREEATKFYRGDNLSLYGDSGDGLSQVVSRDTMEAIESMLPSLMKPFVAGDETVRFEPTGPEDEEGAKQATEYVNYVFQNHNDAFRVIHDSLKDGLLLRFGCAKVVHEEVNDRKGDRYEKIDEQQLQIIESDQWEESIVGNVEKNPDGSFNVNVESSKKSSKFRVITIPTNRFLYEEGVASLDHGTFFGHHDIKPVGDLIEAGLDKKLCLALSAGTPTSLTNELEDKDDERWGSDDEGLASDDLARRVWSDECYIRCDYEGDGVLRWRRVILGGNDNSLLLNEDARNHPFIGWTPIPEPHKLIGMSMADMTRDIQMQKTAIKREALNALYLANRPMQEVVEGQVNWDDLLTPSVGGKVRVKQVGMIREIPSGGERVLGESLQMIEALDSEREARTGVTRYNQGMDANSLNHTATGVSIISNASMQRQELVARQYAESFLKPLFKKLRELVSTHQTKAETIRLSGKWVDVDPSDWKTGYDMSVAVGLGTGNKDQVIAQITNLLQIDQNIVELQGGINGPLLTGENIYEKLKRMVEAMGLKGVERYYTDPAPKQGTDGQPAQQEQQPDPAAAQQQAEQAAQQAEMAKHAAELQQKHDTAVEIAHIDAEAKRDVARIGAEQAIIVAGMQVPPELAAPANDDESQQSSGDNSADDFPAELPAELPQEPAEAPLDIHPDDLAMLMAQEPEQAPDDLPPEMQI